MRITKNEIKYIRSLSQKKVRQLEQKFIVEGWRSIKEVLNSRTKIEFVGVLSRYMKDIDYQGILTQIGERSAVVRELTELELDSIADTVHAQGIIAVVSQKSLSLDDGVLQESSLVVVADGVSDPGNLGSIIRSCDWFNVDVLILGKGCVELHNEKVVRSTVGSVFHLRIIEGQELTSTMELLKAKGYFVIALSGDGKRSYNALPTTGKLAVILGNEAHGLSSDVRTLSDDVVRIPKYGKAESLNVGVACGIVLAHIRGQNEERKGT
jgi:RNA methyltransferase, TrmH family